MTSTQLVPALLVPFVAWRIYRRYRRHIGRQLFRRGRLVARVIFFSLLTLGVGLAAMTHPPSLLALGGGLLLPAPLAVAGLRLTKFEVTPEGRFYTPNTAIGVALIVLFAGRMCYRVFALMTQAPTLTGEPPPQMFQSPLTMLILGLTAGYYIAYYSGVLLRTKQSA